MLKLCLSFALASLFILACKKDPVDELYFPQVKSIVQSSCISCHAFGGSGMPVILETDDDIASRADIIKASVIDPPTLFNKRMPQTGELTQSEKDIIQKWFDKGGRKTD